MLSRCERKGSAIAGITYTSEPLGVRMIGLLRLALFILAIEAIFYGLLWVYLRSTRRESLEREWDRRHPEKAGPSEERAAFVRRFMQGYGARLRRRLSWLVLVLPLVVIMTIIFFVNYR